MKMRKVLLLFCLLFAVVSSFADVNRQQFMDLCVKHKEDLLSLEKNKGIDGRKDRTINYISRSKQLSTLIQKYENGENLSYEESELLMSILVEMAKLKLYHGILYESPVIEDELVPEILVSALKDEKTNEIAQRYIADFSRPDLEKLSTQIIENIDYGEYPKKKDIDWSLLFFTQKEQNRFSYLLIREMGHNSPEEISRRFLLRIKLGDKEAFSEMRKLLKETDNFQIKENIVKCLGLLGSRESIILLLDSMNDNQELQKGLTLRAYIIPAIWRNYPDDDLFVKHFHRRIDDDLLGKEKGIAIFYEELKNWAKQTINYEPDFSRANCVILDPYGTVRKFPLFN